MNFPPIKATIFKHANLDIFQLYRTIKSNSGESYSLDKLLMKANETKAKVDFVHVQKKPVDLQMYMANIMLVAAEESITTNESLEITFERVLQQALQNYPPEPEPSKCQCFGCQFNRGNCT